MVIWSSPAWPRRSSSLPNALTENGQVGSRNTSKTRGPWPQTSGSARHVFFIPSFLFRLVHKRRRPQGDQTLRPEKPAVRAGRQRHRFQYRFGMAPKVLARSLVPAISEKSPYSIPAVELLRCMKAGQFLERLFERCIQQFETEIDFGFGGRQRRCNTHHPIGSAGAHNVGAQPKR